MSTSSKNKFFVNPFDDYSTENAMTMIENGTISTKWKCSYDPTEKWNAVLTKFKGMPYNDNSVYTGTSGIALLKLRKNPKNRENLQDIIQLVSLNRLRNKYCSFLCGDAGPIAIAAVASHRLQNKSDFDDNIERLRMFETKVMNVTSASNMPCEYLYGRAGYLYALLFVNKNVNPAPFDYNFMRKIVESILICGKNEAKAGKFSCPLMYEWHGSYYLGAAHGLCGILYLLLQAKQFITQAELYTLIKPTINYLLTMRLPSGNFPSSMGKAEDKYVQWCHGAPGFVHLFCHAYKLFGDGKFYETAKEACEVIWSRGLIKKGYSLCHGVAGNAYAFLEMFQTTDEDKYLYRAMKFAEWCHNYDKKFEQHTPDRPLSLFEGISGPMYLLLDIQDPHHAKFPGYTV